MLGKCTIDDSEVVGEEIVNQNLVIHKPESDLGEGGPINQPIMAARYDTLDAADAADVYAKLSTLRQPFTKEDPKFWFNNFERTIKHFGVQRQQTKYEALINQLTKDAVDEVKSLLSLDEDEQGPTPYLDLKTELLKIYKPRPEDTFAKAMSRVLVGKPSTLGKQIINDFCKCPKKLTNPCCADIALGLWTKNLPTYIKAHISDQDFNKDTYQRVFDMADKCWLTHRSETPAVAAIKAENEALLKDSDDVENPAVAAIRSSRGRGGGQRGNRGGQRSGRGAGRDSSNNNRGGGSRPQGSRHPQALEGSCYIHAQFGPEAWSCGDRLNCPMKDTVVSKKASRSNNAPNNSTR